MVIFRKKHKYWFFFRFPRIRSFPQFSQCSMPRSLHVQCTFTVSSLRARGTCRKKYEVCEGRCGKRSRLYFGFRLCSFVFATFAEREHFAQGTVGGRNPAPLYLHPKTNPRTPSLTLGLCLVVSKKEVEWPKSCTTSMTKDTQHWTWGYRGCTNLSKLYLLVLVQDFVHQPSRKSIFFFSARKPYSHPTHPITARDHASRTCANKG